MGILIGMDEAGYGPNLGPLVVAATAWHVPGELASASGQNASARGHTASSSGRTAQPKRPDTALASAARPNLAQHDLYPRLRTIVAKRPNERRIAIADSKVLYKPGLGLRQLERGLHAVFAAIQRTCTSWSEIVTGCGADPEGRHHELAWHDGFDCRLPVDATADELARLGPRLAKACEAACVRPLAIRARLVFPAEFNELVEHYGGKGAALSHVTVGLLREVIDALSVTQVHASIVDAWPPASAQLPSAPVFALCDKHGGRNFYTALLQHHFSEHWIEPVYESRTESRYEWGPPESRVSTSFRMNGEAFLPTALASMTAKYLRELAMRAFNEFWCARLPDLRPTAGYPADAHRFRKAIAPLQRRLSIDDHVLWRNR